VLTAGIIKAVHILNLTSGRKKSKRETNENLFYSSIVITEIIDQADIPDKILIEFTVSDANKTDG